MSRPNRLPTTRSADYGLIGDTHSTALIDRNGSIDWLCWPRHDSPALFLRLLDAGKGGACWIEVDKLVSVSPPLRAGNQ